jgi:chromosome segregation protein
MLKALELSGFKSFADKTRFEFPPGITVVVGPNGSGKSNIVDAIKWVLGEQSAKSLRGKDMSDVIFKGSSGANSRRPANSATATIILDNSDQRFAFDADEVHVCRRVYRSGESEYLINGEASRLKDIRELFRGTGVGTDAYSLIEQGKVERLLQTSAKDRRAIFEEAAGISRFKAKKVEAQRRLARVEGNLIRLADIVEEVGSRYRSVKAQASKAARYKDYADRLQQLRTFVGLKDWRSFSEKLEKIREQQQSDALQEKELSEQIEALQAESNSAEDKLEGVAAQLTQQQELVTNVRERIAQTESTISLNRQRSDDLEQRRVQLEDQLSRASQRSAELQKRIEGADAEAETAELNYGGAKEQLKSLESGLAEIDLELESLSDAIEHCRAERIGLSETVSQLQQSVATADAKIEGLTADKSRCENRVASLVGTLQSLQESFDAFNQEKERLQQEAEANDSALAAYRQEYDRIKSELAARKERLSELSSQHAGLTQRAEVIEELERSLEGINAGAKEILQKAGTADAGPLREVVGLVADLISVNVQHAAIVDVALGEFAQYIVVDGHQLINEIADERMKLAGRVGLIQLNQPPTLGANPDVNLNGVSGIIGRTDRLVQVKPEFTSFIRQLLGGTWVVKTLGDALHLHASHGDGENVRMVTLDGEIVEADGSVVVGPKSVAAGLVSRRSELRALNREIQKLTEEIAQCRQQAETLAAEEVEAEAAVQKQLNTNKELAALLADQTVQARSAEEEIRKTNEQHLETQSLLDAALTQLSTLLPTVTNQRDELEQRQRRLAALNDETTEKEIGVKTAQKRRLSVEKEATTAKVKLAKAEQLLDGLQIRNAQIHQEYEEQRLACQQLTEQQQADELARSTAEQEIDAASKQLVELSSNRDQLMDLVGTLSRQRLELDESRRETAMALAAKRDELRQVQDRLHQFELRTEQISMQRDQLAERMQDDYGIDLSAVEDQPTDEELEKREQIDAEITSLRQKISSIGSVNMEALHELEELEERYTTMDAQYQDLVQAKESLQKIIIRIDADSRKLFVETLEAIRQNFQKLFRQTFGGGQADILLEEGVDPLEAGVEIIATPPGKPQFSNSLLSGGEKALTAVSLLMAIFQFRPSPFCVLDEVDAPFDEANIGRFIDVLKSFLGWTKFVIVTHSKKTMTAATTLYGITMQESGVSKRVSVRFEDVSEDGHISEEAIRRSDEDAA